jgi:transposase
VLWETRSVFHSIRDFEFFANAVPCPEGGERESTALPYTEAFRAKMVQRMLGPSAKSATALAEEIGIHQPTLSRWLRDARTLGSTMPNKKKRDQKWPSSEKLRIVLAASQLKDDELGAFLRREGLHEHQLERWRKTILAALDEDGAKKPSGPSPEAKELAAVQRDLRRKDKALAEVSALLVLKKKADAIWGVVDDDTDERTGK